MRRSPRRRRVFIRWVAVASVCVAGFLAWMVVGRGATAVDVGPIVRSHAAAIYDDPDAPVSGNANGDVSIVEFFDYNCVHCRSMAPVLQEIAASDSGVRIIYKELPFLSQGSAYAALAALAADNQGAYLSMHRQLMALEDEATQAVALSLAESLGLDRAQLQADMRDPSLIAVLDRNRALGQALKIDGTPVLLIGDRMLRGTASARAVRNLIEDSRSNNRSNM